MPPIQGQQAVVIGAGVAGLLAARVLSERFQVTVIERDQLPDKPVFRAGIPQSRHIHGLLKRGQLILERLFPGLDAELAAAGAPDVDMIGDFKALLDAGWQVRFPSVFRFHTCSRELVEWCIRKRVVANAQIRLLEKCEVIALLPDEQSTGVLGVQVRTRRGAVEPKGHEETLTADFVVDASGRNSQVVAWLEQLNYRRPHEQIINSGFGYASRLYQRPGGVVGDWKMLAVFNGFASIRRGGVIFPIESEHWLVTLGGQSPALPPTDEIGFLEFMRQLPSPLLYEAVQAATPLSPVYGYRQMENRRRYFERLKRWPDGFIVLGDAACAFSPYYGQGMSVAALGAEKLELLLRKRPGDDLRGMSHRFQQELGKVNNAPWLLATTADLRSPMTQGARPGRLIQVAHWYADGLQALMTRSPQALLTYMEVAHLLKPPIALARPDILSGVLWQLAIRRG